MEHANKFDLSPDCTAGKHDWCDQVAWCVECDEAVPCECRCHG
jgi:hypothetical protein